MGFPSVLVLLSVAVTAAFAADPPVYCKVDNSEYYMRQWGQCKACDRCPDGFGLNSKKSVEVDPVHGALKCRGCLKCTEGKTFKSTIGYEECQRCTNCTAIGKQVDVACTTRSDAVCIEIPPKETAPADLQQNGVDGIAASSEKRSEKEATGMNLTTIGIGAMVLVVTICVSTSMAVVIVKRKGLNCWGKNCPRPKDVDEEQGGLNYQDGDSPVTMETSFDSETVPLRNMELHNDLSVSCEQQESIENDDFPPLPSTFSFNLGSSLLVTGRDVDVDAGRDVDVDAGRDVDVDAGRLSDAGQVPDSRSQKVPDDRELQGLDKFIAHENNYARLGRELGVNDNEIKRIKEEQGNDLRETSFQTLKRWREIKGKGATIGVLRQALRKVGLSVDILENEWAFTLN